MHNKSRVSFKQLRKTGNLLKSIQKHIMRTFKVRQFIVQSNINVIDLTSKYSNRQNHFVYKVVKQGE